MSAKVIYDRTNCEGFWVCTAVDPSFVENEKDDKADLEGATEVEDGLLVLEVDDEEAIELAAQAAHGCPVDVIRVETEDGETIAGPEEVPLEDEVGAV